MKKNSYDLHENANHSHEHVKKHEKNPHEKEDNHGAHHVNNNSSLEHEKMHMSSKDHMHHEHSTHHADMLTDYRKRFIVSLVLTIPVFLISPMIQDYWD